MSLRFRKSFKLGGGVKLNLGKKGFSVSAGTRGARITMGTSGTRVTGGIPGTGLSYTKKLDGGSYSTGGMTTRQINAEIRRMEKEEQIQRAESELKDEIEQYEHFTKIAKYSPNLLTLANWEEELKVKPFSTRNYGITEKSNDEFFKAHLKELTSGSLYFKNKFPYLFYGSLFSFFISISNYEKDSNVLLAFTVLGSMIGFVYGFYCNIKWYFAQRNEAKHLAESDCVNLKKSIEEAKSSHPELEERRIAGIKSLMSGDFSKLENQLEDEITMFEEEALGLKHSFETEISFEINSPNSISLDVDLPEIEDVAITDSKKVLKSGKVSEKEKSQKVINQEYASGVLGIAFNLASHTFNVSPSITEVVISGYTQRVNKKTGNIEDDYIYSVTFTRSAFTALNLKDIDPIEAITTFQLKMELSKAFEFKKIEPISLKDKLVAS